MAKRRANSVGEDAAPGNPHYEALLRLERLEELREDMAELGISTRAELDTLIARLHADLDRAGG